MNALDALAQEMRFGRAHYHLAVALLHLDKPQEALRALESWAAVEPQAAAPYRWMARVYEQQLDDLPHAVASRAKGREVVRRRREGCSGRRQRPVHQYGRPHRDTSHPIREAAGIGIVVERGEDKLLDAPLQAASRRFELEPHVGPAAAHFRREHVRIDVYDVTRHAMAKNESDHPVVDQQHARITRA